MEPSLLGTQAARAADHWCMGSACSRGDTRQKWWYKLSMHPACILCTTKLIQSVFYLEGGSPRMPPPPQEKFRNLQPLRLHFRPILTQN